MKNGKSKGTVSNDAIGAATAQPDNGTAGPEGLEDVVPVLVFAVGGRTYAIGIDQTEGVVVCPRVSPLPNPPEGFAGVASIRGRMTIIVDLSMGGGRSEKQRCILLKGEAQLGLLADHVEGVAVLSAKRLRKSGRSRSGSAAKRGKGSEDRWAATATFSRGTEVVPILDVDRLAQL
jgi:chemotaxis signal transduction protein